jgi:UDP-arabinose 4-epimerase
LKERVLADVNNHVRNVLVTGGAGYIGSHTAKGLARAGYNPVVLDDLSSGRRSAVKWGPFVEGGLADTELLRQVLREQRIEAVIHFAASLLVAESMTNPHKYFWNNVVNTLKLLDAMLETGVKHIVFSSSAAVYGTPERVPILEDHPKDPINAYGESKLAMERAIKWYGVGYGMRWMALRYFNAAGADPEGELGEDHDPETHLIPLVVKAALGQRAYVEVYGTDYPTVDGTAIRDYIDVTDLADAHVRALQHITEGAENLALNLGTGRGHSVREVIASVGSVCKREVPVRNSPRRPGDPPSLVADPSRAFKVLGWRPRRSDLDSIVKGVCNWYSLTASTTGVVR